MFRHDKHPVGPVHGFTKSLRTNAEVVPSIGYGLLLPNPYQFITPHTAGSCTALSTACCGFSLGLRFVPEDGRDKFLRNFVPSMNFTELQPGRPYSLPAQIEALLLGPRGNGARIQFGARVCSLV